MTDNEIKKVFEEHIERTKNLKYGARKMVMVDVELLKNTLDLINRKNEELYRLKEVIIMGRYTSPIAIRAQQSWFRQNSEYIKRLREENERLTELLKDWKTMAYNVADEKDNLYCEAVERVKTTKAEAIKEFAERLNNEAYKNVGIDEDFLFYDFDDNFKTFDSVADVIEFLSEIVIKEMVSEE